MKTIKDNVMTFEQKVAKELARCKKHPRLRDYTSAGVTRLVALTHFGEPPKELVDYVEASCKWYDEGGEEPGLPQGYAYAVGTKEQAEDEHCFDLVDGQGLLYVFDGGHPGATNSYSGPIPKAYREMCRL